ncbi:hypothetical protein VPH35_045193 [Triticum aestivum]
MHVEILQMWNAMINFRAHLISSHLISQEKKVKCIVLKGYKYSAATGGAAALPPARFQEPASAASLRCSAPTTHAPTFLPSLPAVRSPTRGRAARPIPPAASPTPLLFVLRRRRPERPRVPASPCSGPNPRSNWRTRVAPASSAATSGAASWSPSPTPRSPASL